MTIDQIIEEFQLNFTQDTSGEKVEGYLLAPSGEGFVKIALPGDVERFFRTSFASYKEGLAEKVEKMRSEVSMQPRFPGGPAARRIQWQMEALENVLTLIKES